MWDVGCSMLDVQIGELVFPPPTSYILLAILASRLGWSSGEWVAG